MALRDNWKGFWSFAKDNLTDDSGNGGTLSGTFLPSRITGGGKPNAYQQYNGTTQTVFATGSGTNMTFTDGAGNDLPFSVSVWVRPTTTGSVQVIFYKRNSGTPLSEWQLVISATNSLNFRLWGNNAATIQLGQDLAGFASTYLNQWVHVVWTYDGSETSAGIKLYINSVLTATTANNIGTYNGMNSTGTTMWIGSARATGSNSNYFAGDLDNYGIRSGVLTQQEVNVLYNNGNGFNPFSSNGILLSGYGYSN